MYFRGRLLKSFAQAENRRVLTPPGRRCTAKWILCEHLFMLTNKMSEQGCYVENVIVWAVMADILAVMVYGWYRMMKDDE
jgi:hypothetical protein